MPNRRHASRPVRHGQALLVAAMLCLAAPPSAAQSATADQLKAAFLFQFASLTQWPQTAANAAGARELCVLGAEGVAETLQRAAQARKIDGRAVSVRGLQPDAEAEGCDLLFIGTAHSAQRAQWLDRLANSPVLVVDEGAEFAWPNGMIRLHAEGARFRFEVNPTAIERAGLKLDPRLLRLADIATAP